MKKWNWTLFVVIICIAFAGALGNKNFTFTEALIIAPAVGLPIGLLTAYFTKED